MITFFSFLLVLPLTFGSAHKSSDLNSWMSNNEQKQMGINKLTKTEKQSLALWLKKTLNNKIKDSGTAFLTITANNFKKGNLKLNDGSVWQIHTKDINRVEFWQTGTKIKILSSDNHLYPYLFVLAGNGDTAQAQLMSKPLPTTTDPKLMQKYTSSNELWIEQIDKYGRTIILGDNTSWVIAPQHRSTVAEWLIGDNIKIFDQKNPDYPYAIVNANTGQRINAKKK